MTTNKTSRLARVDAALDLSNRMTKAERDSDEALAAYKANPTEANLQSLLDTQTALKVLTEECNLLASTMGK